MMNFSVSIFIFPLIIITNINIIITLFDLVYGIAKTNEIKVIKSSKAR